MLDIKHAILRTLNQIENYYDRYKYKIHVGLGRGQPVMIQPYRGYGNPDRMFIKGRVLEDKGIRSATSGDSLWDNLVNMYKRFGSAEIPFAQVRVQFQGQDQLVTADEEGFFEAWIKPEQPIDHNKLWQQVELELVTPVRTDEDLARATGNILIPPPTARFGVISDIDDTILQTNATRMLQMARTVFLGNAHTRLPFKGVAAFYRSLLEGRTGREMNPLFYVSSSPWNLYDLLSDFFHLQDIPLGPVLFLRDWGLTENELLPTGNRNHKIDVCHKILDLYTNLPFILIGDSGQEDPEIYRELVDLYPNRILAIYIRNVSRSLNRPQAVEKLAEEVVAAGSTLILAKDTLPLARHAISQGWISARAFPEVQAEKQAEEAQPTPVEKVLGQKPSPSKEGPTVIIEGNTPQKTEREVEQGAIESALQEETETHQKPTQEEPPNVIVKGDEEESEL